MFGKSAFAAGVAVAFTSVVLMAPAAAQNVPRPVDLPPYFDLGIDVTKLPTNPAEARKYFAGQSPETQQVLLASCRNYLSHPTDAAMPETLVFCAAIIGGLG
jgi:hypothetical protein